MKWFYNLKNPYRVLLAIASWLPAFITALIFSSITDELLDWQAIVIGALALIGIAFTVLAFFAYRNGHPKAQNNETKYSKQQLYSVLYPNNTFDQVSFLTKDEVDKLAKSLIEADEGILSGCIGKLASNHTPSVYFDNLTRLKTLLQELPILYNFYPQFFKENPQIKYDRFISNRVDFTKAFIDRYIQSLLSKATKLGTQEEKARLIRVEHKNILSYEKEMITQEKRYLEERFQVLMDSL